LSHCNSLTISNYTTPCNHTDYMTLEKNPITNATTPGFPAWNSSQVNTTCHTADAAGAWCYNSSTCAYFTATGPGGSTGDWDLSQVNTTCRSQCSTWEPSLSTPCVLNTCYDPHNATVYHTVNAATGATQWDASATHHTSGIQTPLVINSTHDTGPVGCDIEGVSIDTSGDSHHGEGLVLIAGRSKQGL
jgi:hypothetical protein